LKWVRLEMESGVLRWGQVVVGARPKSRREVTFQQAGKSFGVICPLAEKPSTFWAPASKKRPNIKKKGLCDEFLFAAADVRSALNCLKYELLFGNIHYWCGGSEGCCTFWPESFFGKSVVIADFRRFWRALAHEGFSVYYAHHKLTILLQITTN